MGIQPLMFTYSIHPAVTSFCPVLNHLVIIMCRMNKRCLILDMLIAQPTLAIPCCPGAFVTKEQDGKLLEWAHTIKSGFPLFVAAMDESNVRLNDCHVYIPLSLVRQFKEEVVKIVALDKSIYVVGAKKHNEDQIVLQSGWDRFVTSQRIQQNDLLIFIIEGGTRLKVLVLDPSGSEKTFAMGNSSNAQENPPLPPTVTNLSSEDNEVADLSSDDEVIDLSSDDEVIDLSCDDDEVVGKDTTTSRREQRPLQSCHAKAEKMASTSCSSTKSGHKAGKSNEAGLEAPVSNKPYILPQSGRSLTKPQEEKVKEKVQAIGSKFPVFVKVMTPHDVGRPGPTKLCFCVEYASACHLPLKETPLLLRLEGSDIQFPATLSVLRYNGGRRIYGGWRGLVSQAGMEAGDICLVELVDRSSERLTMTVYLICKSEMQL
ncbi:putative B3 domain-containing protein Os03g0621600 isoform X2 [Aegilops tauschii subsp. strangulata]|uniref:TF-B3 domain-containing protein n=1 Tax=Aegilops tauschii subsp. strangulata TaxID=200361 RepID=A0A453R6J7_AEGTS|nr:B3 domain-containing protein Os03g0620400 isoform X2 [Aegilops tauschii subsp. strangulata]